MGIKGGEGGEQAKTEGTTVILCKAYKKRDRCGRERKPGVLQESLRCMDYRSGIHRYPKFLCSGNNLLWSCLIGYLV